MRLLLAILLLAAQGQEGGGQDPVPELPESQWPPEYPALEVLVTPEVPEPREDAPSPAWAEIPFADGGRGSLLGFLRRRLEHEEDWRPSADIAAARERLVPPPPDFDTARTLVEDAKLAMLMGGNFLGMSNAQIYTYFGFLPDGSLPEPAAYGIYAPAGVPYCLGSGDRCPPEVAPGFNDRYPKVERDGS